METSAPRILVVDDNPLVRELVRDTFHDAGFEVLVAGDGMEALSIVRAERPDIVVTDVGMPELDGWGLCEALKSDPDTREIPVVFLASQREVPDRLRGLRMGAHDYLCKPFSTEELLVRVRLILERHRIVLSGHTSHMPMPDLVQLLAMNGKTGTLRVRGPEPGRIHFRDGKIVGASTMRTSGKKALFRIVSWTDAGFEFDPHDDPRVTDAIGPSSQRLLMDALVAADDLARLRSLLPPDATRIGLAEGATELFEVAHELSMVEREVLRAAAEQASVYEMLEHGEETDLEIARAIHHLIEKKAIAPAA